MILVPPPNFGFVEEDLYRSGQPTSVNFPFLARLNLKKIIYLAPDAPSREFFNFVQDQEIELVHLGSPEYLLQYQLQYGSGAMTGAAVQASAPLSMQLYTPPSDADASFSQSSAAAQQFADGGFSDGTTPTTAGHAGTTARSNSSKNVFQASAAATNKAQQLLSASITQNSLGLISEELVLSALEMMLDSDNYPLAVMCNLGRHRTGTVVGCLRKLQNWSLTSILDEYRRYAGNKVRLQNEQFIELFDTDLVRLPSTEKRPSFL